MPFIKCPFCHKQFSDKLTVCPFCKKDSSDTASPSLAVPIPVVQQPLPNQESKNVTVSTGAQQKQGAVIGGWVCLAIATVLMVWSLLSFFLYLPLFVAAFVLGIVAIAQRRLANGIPILLLSVAVPLVLGVGLGVMRTAQLFGGGQRKTRYVPQDNNHPRPLLVTQCRDCHAPGKMAPQSTKHPDKEQCMLCHRDGSTGPVSPPTTSDEPAKNTVGTIKVERAYEERGRGVALVSYVNDSGRTFREVVRIQCDALDSGGKKLGTENRAFYGFEKGAFATGFEGTLEIPVELHGGAFGSASCWISEAR